MREYRELLDTYQYASADQIRTDALTQLHGRWVLQALDEGKDAAAAAAAQLANFYTNNEALYATANDTTADTVRQLADLRRFAAENAGDLAGKLVVDIGCGNGERMTRPMATLLPQSEIIAVDHRVPNLAAPPDNLTFRQGDFSSLPFEEGSVGLATAHWSVLNDLTLRSQQLAALGELARVLEPGGLFYTDVPSLEGEHGYEALALAYHAANPSQPFGMIEREFPGGKRKMFHIYPWPELQALLDHAGFTVEQSEQWVTGSNQARRTIVARLRS